MKKIFNNFLENMAEVALNLVNAINLGFYVGVGAFAAFYVFVVLYRVWK